MPVSLKSLFVQGSGQAHLPLLFLEHIIVCCSALVGCNSALIKAYYASIMPW